MNDWQRTRYCGPCPEAGARAKLEAAMRRHVIDEAVLVGTYMKKGRAAARR